MTGAEQRKTFYVIPQLPEKIKQGNVWVKNDLTGRLDKVEDVRVEGDRIVIHLPR